MTELHATCPSCAAALKASRPGLAGKRVKCPRCGGFVRFPGPAEGKDQRPGWPAASQVEGGQQAPLLRRRRGAAGGRSGPLLVRPLVGGVVLVVLVGVATSLFRARSSGGPAPAAQVVPATTPQPADQTAAPEPAPALPDPAVAAPTGAPVGAESFGLTSDSRYYTVDTGAGLVFKVRRTNPAGSGHSAGDIASLVYNGVEYQEPTRGSHLKSGLGSATVDAVLVDTDTVKVTAQEGGLTQLYMARRGYPHIYMATHITDGVGELRWITRLRGDRLPNRPVESDPQGAAGTAESDDVYRMPDGETRSKFYGNQRAKDLSIRGVAGDGVGIFMDYGNRESSSGGPFFRDIQNYKADVYNYLYSGHNQTEPIRLGLHGPYALVFTDGATPTVPDMSWMDGLGITGWVSPSRRGHVSGGPIAGRVSRYAYTVAFANAEAQYWTDASAEDGSFLATGLKPGTYTLTVYKNELAVLTTTVAVTAGQTTELGPVTITEDPSAITPVWRIGDWDGTPAEFLNGDKVTSMHPSDARIKTWDPGVFTVGASSPATGFPCYQWRGVNGTLTVRFELTPAQVTAHSVRVGITCAYAGARPQIKVNSWSPKRPPGPSSQPDSRSLTIGTYRGNNATYTFRVPASAFVAGTNTLTISPLSGSGGGSGFLTPGYGVDCVDMD